MEAIAPHIRSETVILPVLNGLNHVPLLASRFSEAIVWGGVAAISGDAGTGRDGAASERYPSPDRRPARR